MAPRVTILGGYFDGKVVDWEGYDLRAAIPRHPGFVTEEMAGRRVRVVKHAVEHFKAQQDLDGRWFYVLQPS